LSFAGFTDPVTRPRYIIWSAVGVLTLVTVMILALGITSSRWFCAEGCHKVQDDTIIAYSHSSHNKISCLACHMPVNSSPVTFMLHKAEALGELYLTVTNTYELPLNEGDELALDKVKMPSTQCTQCHNMANRNVTPSGGIIIDHQAHIKAGITCTNCHNRVAHKEDFDLTLPGNEKHADFMKMESCFRCHGVAPGSRAPGRCDACHPAGFELKPANHRQPGFYPKGHAKLAKADQKYCTMCHDVKKFCVDCHGGVEMPHPAAFKTSHGKIGRSAPQACQKCHGTKAGGTEFCNNCHHKGADPNKSWVSQHFLVVREKGAEPCFKCHATTFCAKCHVTGSVNGSLQ
jgi:nitrate/TMAO reductase-like tetraheme cytochrome c subunit